MRKAVSAISILLVILVLAAIWIGPAMYSRIPDDPASALKSFYERDVAEDQLMDPLILAGRDVIPLLERELLNPDMPRRRYAISAIGNIGDKAALPILRKILEDRSEVDYIRCDSLEAISMIDRHMAIQFVRSEPSLRSECGDPAGLSATRRNYLEALLGWHY